MVKRMPVGVFAVTVGPASGAGVIVTSCPLIELTSVTLLSAVLTVKVAVSVNVTGTVVFAATLVGIGVIAMCTWGRFSRFTTCAPVRFMLLVNDTVSVTVW